LALAAAVLAVVPFAGSLAGGFVYDDHALIEQRPAMHSLARLPELWQSEFWQGLSVIHFRYFRPLVAASYAFDWALYGGRPFGFHLTNLLLHAAVAWLLFARLHRWSRSLWGAFLATLAWAWHPSKVEAVSWISGRTDLWCALGVLVVCAGVKRRLSGATRSGAAWEILGMCVALASKEHAVVAPAFVAVETWAHRGNLRLSRAEILGAAQVALPHATTIALYLAIRFVVWPIIPEGAGTISFLHARLYTLETLGEFVRIVLYPFPLSIERAAIRVDPEIGVLHDAARLALGIAFVLLLAYAVWFWRRSSQTAFRAVGLLLGAAALFPVANVVSARMVFLFAERFAYLPLAGFALAVVPSARLRWWTAAPWAIVLIASFALSAQHTRDFLDDRHLWEHELRVNPQDPLALRFACEDAMRRHDYRASLDLAVRGYRAAKGWPVAQPERVEFAMRAARSLELITLDHDTATLQQISRFYETFLEGTKVARIDRPPVRVAVDSSATDAKNFREGDPGRVATMKLWAAIVHSRLDPHCDPRPLLLLRDSLSQIDELPSRVSAALVFARCAEGRPTLWDDALALARSLSAVNPALSELLANLEWARSATSRYPTTAEEALRWSRAQTLLINRGRAYDILLPWKDAILADPEATFFFARTAWAAGEDDEARRALSAHMNESEQSTLLASWSRELGRDGPVTVERR